MPTYNSTFIANGTGVSGVAIAAYRQTRFVSAPTQGSAAPSGPPDTSATTGGDFGSPGAFTLDLATNEPYWVMAEYTGGPYWQLASSLLYQDPIPEPTPGLAEVTAMTINGVPGAPVPLRLIGGTSGGAPVTGIFHAGDVVLDQKTPQWLLFTGSVWISIGGGGGGGGGGSLFTQSTFLGSTVDIPATGASSPWGTVEILTLTPSETLTSAVLAILCQVYAVTLAGLEVTNIEVRLNEETVPGGIFEFGWSAEGPHQQTAALTCNIGPVTPSDTISIIGYSPSPDSPSVTVEVANSTAPGGTDAHATSLLLIGGAGGGGGGSASSIVAPTSYGITEVSADYTINSATDGPTIVVPADVSADITITLPSGS